MDVHVFLQVYLYGCPSIFCCGLHDIIEPYTHDNLTAEFIQKLRTPVAVAGPDGGGAGTHPHFWIKFLYFMQFLKKF